MAWFPTSWGLDDWFPTSWGLTGTSPGYGTKGEGVISCIITERVEVETQDIDSLNTSTVSNPAGDFRIPIDTSKRFSKIISVFLQPLNAGSGFTYELVDGDTTSGPRVRTYINATLQDVVVSGFIRGFRGT